MADGGGVLKMVQHDDRREEFADRLGITVEIAQTIARELRPFEIGDPNDIFGRFRALLRKAYESQPGMTYGDFDKDARKQHITLRSGDGQLLLDLFAEP